MKCLFVNPTQPLVFPVTSKPRSWPSGRQEPGPDRGRSQLYQSQYDLKDQVWRDTPAHRPGAGLAKALDVDPRRLLQLAVEQLAGATAARTFDEIFGTIVTLNEIAWLQELREARITATPLSSRAHGLRCAPSLGSKV